MPTPHPQEPMPVAFVSHGAPTLALDRERNDAPAAAELAESLARRLPGVARADDRPWDHGVWVPMRHMFPSADVPLLVAAGAAAERVQPVTFPIEGFEFGSLSRLAIRFG